MTTEKEDEQVQLIKMNVSNAENQGIGIFMKFTQKIIGLEIVKMVEDQDHLEEEEIHIQDLDIIEKDTDLLLDHTHHHRILHPDHPGEEDIPEEIDDQEHQEETERDQIAQGDIHHQDHTQSRQ